MQKQDLVKLLRLGGSRAVTAFVENCVDLHEQGGVDAVCQWITLALPQLPEPERAALVTLLMESLLSNYDVAFEDAPQALH